MLSAVSGVIMTILQILFSARGRIRRRDYWLWSLGLFAVVVIVLFGIAFVTRRPDADSAAMSPAGVVLTVLLPFIFWAQTCLQIKRWHDRNKSGVMIFVNLIPLIGQWWAFAETCVLEGTKGANTYGPSPKGIDTTHRVF